MNGGSPPQRYNVVPSGKGNGNGWQVAGQGQGGGGAGRNTNGQEEIELIPLNDDATRVKVRKRIRRKPKNKEELDNEQLTLGMATALSHECKEEFEMGINEGGFEISDKCKEQMRSYLANDWAGERRYRGSEALDKVKEWEPPKIIWKFRWDRFAVKLWPFWLACVLGFLAWYYLCREGKVLAWIFQTNSPLLTKSDLKKLKREAEREEKEAKAKKKTL